jgi:DNA-binding response OmpR family regulator
MLTRGRVLVVEDDSAIRRGIVDALTFEGYLTVEAGTGEEGMAAALGGDIDVMLLDLVLPGRDGFEVLSAVRRHRPDLLTIVLTARGEQEDRIRGLKLGADDYVVKPFSVGELLARVEAVLRRAPARVAPAVSVRLPGMTVDLTEGTIAFDDGRQQRLTEREVRLLGYLAGQNGRIVSRQELLTRVWEIDPTHAETRSVDMQVARLREKLDDDSEQSRILQTVRGRGYLLVLEEEA